MNRFIAFSPQMTRIAMCRIFILIFTSVASLNGFTLPTEILQASDSLIADTSNSKQSTYVAVFREQNKTIYFASTAMTVTYDNSIIKTTFENCLCYPQYCRFVKRTEQLGYNEYLVVAGVGIVNSWFLADVDSIVNNGARYRMFIRRNKDPVSNETIRNNEKGPFTIEYHEFSISWLYQELGNGKFRIALVAAVSPSVWIPDWLFRLVSRFVFPAILADFEKEMGRISIGAGRLVIPAAQIQARIMVSPGRG